MHGPSAVGLEGAGREWTRPRDRAPREHRFHGNKPGRPGWRSGLLGVGVAALSPQGLKPLRPSPSLPAQLPTHLPSLLTTHWSPRTPQPAASSSSLQPSLGPFGKAVSPLQAAALWLLESPLPTSIPVLSKPQKWVGRR